MERSSVGTTWLRDRSAGGVYQLCGELWEASGDGCGSSIRVTPEQLFRVHLRGNLCTVAQVGKVRLRFRPLYPFQRDLCWARIWTRSQKGTFPSLPLFFALISDTFAGLHNTFFIIITAYLSGRYCSTLTPSSTYACIF